MPVGFKNIPEVTTQYTVLYRVGLPALSEIKENGQIVNSMVIRTEEQIQNMSAASFKSFYTGVIAWKRAVHNFGTPQAVKAIDGLHHACTSRVTRSRLNSPPVC